MAVAILLVVPLVYTGSLQAQATGQVILLITAFAWFTAGIYLDRVLLWFGIVMAVAYVIMTLLPFPFVWTATGLLIGVGLVLAGIRLKPHRAEQS